jgi:predicted porin
MNANGRSGNATVGLLSNTLGALGSIGGGGSFSGQNDSAWCSATGGTAGGCLNAGTNFDRRQKGILQWWSPNWSGFEGRVAYSATSFGDAVTASNRAAGAIKPSIWDVSIAYNNGPLAVGYAYERQQDLLAYAAASFAAGITNGNGTGTWTITPANVSGSRGTGHRLGGKYAFDLGGGSSIGVGGMWESLKYTLNYGGPAVAATDLTELKKNGWRVQGNFTTGNHFFGLEYARSNELKGSITAGQFNGGGTESKVWMLSYNYAFSKRTSLTAYYVNVTNGSNSVNSGITFAGLATAAGADPKYYGLNLRHTF